MPFYNSHKNSRQARGKSCPAGVTFEFRNDITNYGPSRLRKSKSTNCLEKENNFTRQRRQSFPKAFCDELDLVFHTSFAKESSTHLLNYSSQRTGGNAHNLFCCKLVNANKLSHSSVDASNQHTTLNKSLAHQYFDVTRSFTNELPLDIAASGFSTNSAAENVDSCYNGKQSICEIKDGNEDLLSGLLKATEHPEAEKSLSNLYETGQSNLNRTGKHLDNSFVGRFLQEVSSLEVIEFEDNINPLIQNSDIDDLPAFIHSDVKRLEYNIQGTELLVENLANQVQEAKTEIAMSKRRQENEINDLVSLNEEMQTIWSAKESEVREILERFSAYRDAVEADTKEKDEIYSEQLNKREAIINDLQLTKDALLEQLTRQTEALREVIHDVQKFEATHADQLGDVNQLVACLLEKFSDQEASLVCRSISVKLETSIATIKEKDYARYVSCLNISGIEAKSSEVDEGTGYSILSSSDGERKDYIVTDNVIGSALNNELVNQEQFSSKCFRSCTQIAGGNDEFHETLEEDFVKLLKDIDEFGSDDSLNGYIDKKTVAKLLEDQWSKYQFLCKEKDAEIQHWIRKHKQDTQDLQSILEEQERAEAKSSDSLAELQSEIDKLRQRNKFLESEVEFAKEQGEDDVCFLKESFQKDLSTQLRRQSQTFLSVKESTRNELSELESKNEELQKGNEDLRRQIEKHCTEIKSWVSDILLLSEEEYNEECHSITDVLAKLQKIIIKNKRTMEDLQEELCDYRRKAQEPSSPDILSRSWDGHSWNSMELQKELCRNCKQSKWQRVLMGSFDLVDPALEVKQDEVERFVDKLSIDESKNRKRRSLRDSLELADGQFEHLQRLSRQEFGSLETLGEDSLEESCGRDSAGRDMVDGLSSSKLGDEMSNGPSNAEFEDEMSNGRSNAESGDEMLHARSREENNSTRKVDTDAASMVDKNTAENSDESWNNIHVSPRLSSQYSVLSDPEFNGLHEEFNLENNESGGSGNTEIGGIRSQDVEKNLEGERICRDDGEWLIERDDGEQSWIEQGDKGQEEDEDRVHVVNLYRSLVLESDTPQHKDIRRSEVGGFCGEYYDQNGEYGEQIGKIDNQSGDQTGKLGGESCDQNCESGNQSSKYGDNSGDQIALEEDTYNHHNNHANTQSVVPHDVHFTIPKIIVGKDFNENFLDTQEQDKKCNGVEETYFNEISDEIRSETKIGEFVGETSDQNGTFDGESGYQNGDYNLNFSVVKDEGMPLKDKEILQSVLTDEITIQNLVQPKNKVSESLSISTDNNHSIFEFVGNFAKEIAPCSENLENLENLENRENRENLENLKTKLMEVVANQRKDQENKIFRELEDTKTELRECQSEYEKLDKLYEDYRNYVDEYSGNLGRKNEELRNLKLSSSIMKTEIEWLRQALGITRNYAEF